MARSSGFDTPRKKPRHARAVLAARYRQAADSQRKHLGRAQAGGPDLSLQRDPDAAAIPHGRARPTVATERRIDGLAENLELRAAAVRIARPPARRRS
jgi:hypothetical protein